jgi:hypothetical protein
MTGITELIAEAERDGIAFAWEGTGLKLKPVLVVGGSNAARKHWVPILRERKAEILAALDAEHQREIRELRERRHAKRQCKIEEINAARPHLRGLLGDVAESFIDEMHAKLMVDAISGNGIDEGAEMPIDEARAGNDDSNDDVGEVRKYGEADNDAASGQKEETMSSDTGAAGNGAETEGTRTGGGRHTGTDHEGAQASRANGPKQERAGAANGTGNSTQGQGGGARADAGQEGGRKPKQADILIELAAEADLFHAPDKTCYADVTINGHRETWPIRSKGFRRWLCGRFFEAFGGAPNSEALQAAINTIEYKADYKGPKREVYVRVARLGDRIYLDLGDDAWRTVEIGPDGWKVIGAPPVRFRRSAGMSALPKPKKGGSIQKLRSFLNVKNEDDLILVVAWLLAALSGRWPYPILVLAGEHGSAKSSFTRTLVLLIDPRTTTHKALPREDRDLFIAATNSYVLAFDNVSNLPPWISDTLCRIATRGGFTVRQLYTDQDEVLFDAARPIILNGIEDVVTRPDLADRSIFVTLEAIPEDRRRTEAELDQAFEKERPYILGALLDAVACGLKMLPLVRLERLPRMADFAKWATACETAFWPAGSFLSAYSANRDNAIITVIDDDPVAAAVRSLMSTRASWSGTASGLLAALREVVGDTVVKSKSWPDSPRALSGRLRRAATFLRKVGVEIEFVREGQARTIQITVLESGGSQPSQPSQPSFRWDTNDLADDGPSDGSSATVTTTVTANPLNGKENDDSDGSDAKISTLSVGDDDEQPRWESD